MVEKESFKPFHEITAQFKHLMFFYDVKDIDLESGVFNQQSIHAYLLLFQIKCAEFPQDKCEPIKWIVSWAPACFLPDWL